MVWLCESWRYVWNTVYYLGIEACTVEYLIFCEYGAKGQSLSQTMHIISANLLKYKEFWNEIHTNYHAKKHKSIRKKYSLTLHKRNQEVTSKN